MKNNHSEQNQNAHPFHSLIELYKDHIDVGIKTKRSYESILKQFAYYLQANKVMTPKRQDIIKFRDYMVQIGQSANTIQKTILVIKSFYRFLKMNYQLYNLDPFYIYDITEGIRSARVSKRLKRLPLTLEQAQLLLKAAKLNCISISGYRNYAIILLMITTGLRGIEIIRAKKKNLAKMGNISILYVQGKGRQESDEFVKISQVVTNAFNDYLNLRSDNSRYLFVSHSIHTSAQQLSTYMLNKMMKENLKRAGISDFKLTIHSLRHTAATFNLLRGGSIEATQALLRHQSIETTMIYLHHINRVKDDSEFQIERYILDDSKKKESADESKSST